MLPAFICYNRRRLNSQRPKNCVAILAEILQRNIIEAIEVEVAKQPASQELRGNSCRDHVEILQRNP